MNTPRGSKAPSKLALKWKRLGPRFLPFADAATPDLPLPRLLRLGLFQVSVGMATALMVGTLNRVMIVELGVAAWLVALMVALPIIAAPLRAFIGHKSDVYASAIGWRRVPYIGLGAFLQFAGLALLPFALLLLTGQGRFGLAWVGHLVSGLSFLLVGAGLQTTQTAGLALASDLSTDATRPRVVALMYVMLLVGLVGGGTVFGLLLADFSPTRLVQVVQGAGVATAALCVIAVWKQEARNPNRRRSAAEPAPAFGPRWQSFIGQPKARRFLVTVGLGTMAFAMQDVVLEPYGGEILKLSVGATSSLTAVMALGALVAFALAARWLARGGDPYRVAACGLVLGLPAFAAIIFSAPAEAPWLFRCGTALIGFGGHAHRGHVAGAPRPRGPGARRLGRGAGHGRRPGHRSRRRAARPGVHAGHARGLRRSAGDTGHRLQLRLPPRAVPLVRGADCHRPARSLAGAVHPDPRHQVRPGRPARLNHD
jgi:BCD family chlorophyll transporter-like MFS transporter